MNIDTTNFGKYKLYDAIDKYVLENYGKVFYNIIEIDELKVIEL